jgi:hypothetical protein
MTRSAAAARVFSSTRENTKLVRQIPKESKLDKLEARQAFDRGGFEQALGECGVDHADLIWLPRYCPIKLFRNGLYPPLRGTSIILDDDQAILYTRGSVDFFRTYPGQYVPRPLWLRIARRDSPSIDQLLTESLTLTKMN